MNETTRRAETSHSSNDWVGAVVRFWFDDVEPKAWWGESEAFDHRIRTRFGALHERLVRSPPEVATLDAEGHLATVIVFDQFSRNLFRGSPLAFAADAQALVVTLDAIDRGMDDALADTGRQFLYMPLMHSEDPTIQQRSLVQFARLADPRALRSAQAHFDTIARFGRFPYRNAALERTSTPEEQAFLAKHPAPE